jgi:ribosomal protein S19E (S16A)
VTLRFHAVRGSEAYPRGRLAAGGRWERLLRRLHSDGPLRMGQLSALTDPGHHDRKLERAKVRTALQALARSGLVEPTEAGWAVTPQGAEALDRLDEASGAPANDPPTPGGRTA